MLYKITDKFTQLFIDSFFAVSDARRRFNYALIGLLWLSYTLIIPAEANPDLDKIVSGNVNIVESQNKLDVIQNSQKAIIDWRSFNIDAGEHTQFHHVNSSAVTLNRVTGVDPSKIMGRLSANGNIILINPNGILFGAGSRVDVNSMLATTSDISNENFLKGKMIFNGSNPLAKIINRGEIVAAKSGFIGLIAPSVENSGIIRAKLGKVTLASGDKFTFDMYGDGLLEIAVENELAEQTIKNSGVIDASGGEIYITAAAGNEVANSLIEISGELKAPAVEERGGKIYIFAEGRNAVSGNVESEKGIREGSSKVIVSGKLDVSGSESGQIGGEIQILGDYVGLMYGAAVVASGSSGGGEVYVGGDYLGGSEENRGIATALNTYVDEGVSIDVSATGDGDGGKAILWGDGSTSFYGEILARGGSESGDGGFVEVSGKNYLEFRGDVNTSAVNGEDGELLLDPGNIIVCQFGGALCASPSPSLTASSNTFDTGSNNGDSYVNIGAVGVTGSLLDLLNSNNVTLRTNNSGTGNGDITILNGISSASSKRLTLRSHGTTIFADSVSVRNLDVYANDVVINQQNAASQNITISSNNGNGLARFMQFTNNKSFGIGDGVSGDIQFSDQEISQLQNWGRIEFGNNNNTGGINIGGLTFDADVVLRTSQNINVTDDITILGNDYLSFVSNDIDIQGNLFGSNAINFLQHSNNTTMGIGDGAIGSYHLSTAELNRIQDGFSEIIIGNNSNNADMQIASHTWLDRVRFQNRNGIMNFVGTQNFTDNATIQANNLNIAADLLGSNTLTISSRDAGMDVIIGGDAINHLSIDSSEIAHFSNKGWASVVLGNANSSANLDVNAVDWHGSDIKFLNRNGSVNILGTQTFDSDQNLMIETNNLEVLADINGGNLLQIFTRDNNKDYVIGGSSVGALSLENSEVARFNNSTWNNIIIGQSDDQGTKTIGANTWNTNIEFLSRTGLVDVVGTQNAQNNDLTFTTRSLSIGAALTGSAGRLIIAPEGNNSMGIGTGQAGTLQISDASLANIQSGFDEVVFGRSGLRNVINVGTNTWQSNLTLHNNNSEIRINGDQNLGANDLKIISNRDVRINNQLIGTGDLFFETDSVGASIGIGGAGGNLNINDADLANIQDGWNSITIGRADGTGTLRLNDSTFNDNIILQTGTGQIRIDQAITVLGGNDLSIISDGNPVINNNIIGTGNLNLKTQSAGTSLGIAGGSGTYNLSAAEVGRISDGWNKINIGRSDGSGDINIGASTWSDNIEFQSNSGIISVLGAINAGANDITFRSNADINIAQSITGTGNLKFLTQTNAADIGVGLATMDVNLSAPELDRLADGFASIQFGDANYTGNIEVGSYSQWKDPVQFITGSAGSVLISGNNSAIGNGSFTFNSLVSINAASLSTDLGDINFNRAVNLQSDTSISSASGNINFADSVNGNKNLNINTTGNVNFNGIVGAITSLKDVVVQNVNNLVAQNFTAETFTQNNGSGTTNFTGLGLVATGNVSINTSGNIAGSYSGDIGALTTLGAINAKVTFNELDIDSLTANLQAGKIGNSSVVNQNMANLITIRGIGMPVLVANPNYKFANFTIGAIPKKKNIRSDSIVDQTLSNIENGMTLLEQDSMEEPSDNAYDDVSGGVSCSGVFYNAESCSERGRQIFIFTDK